MMHDQQNVKNVLLCRYVGTDDSIWSVNGMMTDKGESKNSESELF
jgi:hypothetical protein